MTSGPEPLVECVINVSEGRDSDVLAALRGAGGTALLDLHSDADHNRAVLTLAGPPGAMQEAARAVARAAVSLMDLGAHQGVHPRFGVLDVVPWVTLQGWPIADGPIEVAVEARQSFAAWAGSTLDLPCFLYGPERSLPEVRRLAWQGLSPDAGPTHPHPTAGATAVGARPVLLAYNLWLAESDLALARRVAAAIRRPGLRTLALPVGASVQVSCNLTDPWTVGPEAAFDAVASQAVVARAELVGLVPRAVLERVPRQRWRELDLDPSTTIEARLEQAGLDGGRFAAHGH
jgi:glutamate formiminotransferase